MLLDDLVTTIETVQGRIREHGNALSQNEYRTRISLIDPILTALGWDVSDPSVVTLEYRAGAGRADYALLGKDGKPRIFIEAKSLGEQLENHRKQARDYATEMGGVKYSGLTDGNRWIVEDLQRRVLGHQDTILGITISEEQVQQCALKLLLLWHATLATGHPLEANEPILASSVDIEASPHIPKSDLPPLQPPNTEAPSSEWIPLASYDSKLGKPTKIRLPSQSERTLRDWPDLLVKTAEWLIRKGLLTKDDCPVPVGGRNQRGSSLIGIKACHINGKEMGKPRKLYNGFWLNIAGSSVSYLNSANYLLRRFDQDPDSVLLKSE